METNVSDTPDAGDSQYHHADLDSAMANDNPDSAHPTPHDSPLLSPTGGDENPKSNIPIQKRRRVTRACDECRRKKIKCDGKQPCTHCTVYGYECTYDQPSNRRRNPAPHQIEHLEKQLARANAILRALIDTDVNDPNLETKLQQGLLTVHSPPQQANNTANSQYPTQNGIEAGDSHLESMVRSTGQLDLDEQGNLEFHGHSSGLTFVKRMREQFGDLMIPEGQGTPFVKSRPMSQVFDSPRSTNDSPWETSSGSALDLPPKDVARMLCDNAIEDAGSLLRVVHYPTFLKQLDAIYDTPHDHYGNSENMFLPLLYSVLALGTLFSRDEVDELDRRGYESVISEGFKYFRLARSLMDIADCRDIRQIQAIVFMIMFLQSSAKLSTCYAYIGVALRSAMRMGLHRSFPDSFNPIEAETRKRVFWVIQRMDTYVGALLGLPHSLSDDDIDQEFPAEVDDEYITEQGILPQPDGHITAMAAGNAHTKLVQILDKIVRHVYPLKGSGGASTPGKGFHSYSVSYSKILEIERDLKNWQDKLPASLKPGGDAPNVIVRVRHLLRMAYAHAQMMLYRPFLHYVSQVCKSRVIDKRSYACAAACVSVSRNIIHIAIEMKRRGLLVGAYWFTMYTTFFAILSLVFYALENPENDASQDVLRVATEGKDTLGSFTKRSMAADRCYATLQALFEQLPERISRTRQNSVIHAKKRKQDSSPHDLFAKTAHSDSQGPELMTPPARASTFPHVRSRSVDRKPHILTPKENVQKFEAMGFPNANTTNFYDLSHSNPIENISTPPLSAGVSQSQESFPGSPGVGKEVNFPLADLSSMMFPGSDPIAYPNQSAAPAQSYDDILKNLTNDPTFPFPNTLDEFRMQRAAANGGFIPPSSTFSFNSPEGGEQTDVLLPSMPSFMNMTSPENSNRNHSSAFPSSSNNFNSPGMDTGSSFFNSNANGQNAVANVNLDQLLGGEEWAGLSTNSGYASMGQMFGPPGLGLANAGNFKSASEDFGVDAGASAAMNTSDDMIDVPQNGQPSKKLGTRAVTFEDLNPGVLGWNLHGY